MKYSPEVYAEAFVSSLADLKQSEEVDFLRKFVKSISVKGDIGRADKIVRAIEKSISQKEGGHIVEVESAREISVAIQKKFAAFFSPKDRVEFIVNPELEAGFRVTVDGEKEYSNALSMALKKMFP